MERIGAPTDLWRDPEGTVQLDLGAGRASLRTESGGMDKPPDMSLPSGWHLSWS